MDRKKAIYPFLVLLSRMSALSQLSVFHFLRPKKLSLFLRFFFRILALTDGDTYIHLALVAKIPSVITVIVVFIILTGFVVFELGVWKPFLVNSSFQVSCMTPAYRPCCSNGTGCVEKMAYSPLISALAISA